MSFVPPKYHNFTAKQSYPEYCRQPNKYKVSGKYRVLECWKLWNIFSSSKNLVVLFEHLRSIYPLYYEKLKNLWHPFESVLQTVLYKYISSLIELQYTNLLTNKNFYWVVNVLAFAKYCFIRVLECSTVPMSHIV